MSDNDNDLTTGKGYRNSNRTMGRRGLLKTTGVTLAGLTVPVAAASGQSDRTSDVDPSDRDSVIAFVKRLDDVSEDEARKMWEGMSEEKAENVSKAIDKFSHIEEGQATLIARDSDGNVISKQKGKPEIKTVSSDSSVSAASTGTTIRTMSLDDEAAIAQAEGYDYSDTVRRETGPVTVYSMDASLSWEVPTSSRAYPMGGSSSGSGEVPYWVDIQEETGTTSTQGSYAQTTREREYKHDNPVTTTYYTAKMVLQGSTGGSGTTVVADPNV